MTATREMWAIKPVVGCTTVPYHGKFSCDAFAKITQGLVPKAMEDKWFIFYEAPHLYVHRSWTAYGAYRITLETSKGGAHVVEALCATEHLAMWQPDYHATLIDWLIRNLLLGERRPFPLPPGEGGHDGLFQHHIAGTGYAETPAPSPTKPWWRPVGMLVAGILAVFFSQVRAQTITPATNAEPRSLADAQSRLEKIADRLYDPNARFSASGAVAELTAVAGYLRSQSNAPTELRDALVMIGIVEGKRQENVAALAALQEAFAIQSARPQTAERAAYDHYQLAELAKEARDVALAATHYEIALDNMQREPKFSEDQRLGTRQELAFALHEVGRYTEALQHNQTALAGGENQFGRDDTRLRTVIVNIAQNLHALNRKAEAKPYLERALGLARKGGSVEAEQDMLFQLGVLAFELGRYDDARRHMNDRIVLLTRDRSDKLASAREDLATLEIKIRSGAKQ